MSIPLSVDKYLIIAHQRGLLEIKEKLVLLTDSGRNELDSISDECMELMKGPLGYDFDQMADQVSASLGREVSKRETFQMVMRSMVGTEARLLAFLLNERETNFDALTKAIKETLTMTAPEPEGPNVTKFRKKPKLDS
jgi:hypothetical protein